jgi:Mg-chelatase subunit ChlD
MDQENLGAAERIIQSLIQYSDHLFHNRPGIVVPDARFNCGVRWEQVTHKEEGEPKQKVAYRVVKGVKRNQKVRVGVIQANNQIKDDRGAVVGDYRPAGIFPEVAAWMYRQVAEVWKLDNEFAARWASYAYTQDQRDMKVVLAAFMLVQSRKGDPVLDGGKMAFHDEDFRDVGEAMILTLTRKAKGKDAAKAKDAAKGKDAEPDFDGMDAKMLLRVYKLLTLPSIASINRELGFGKSARDPFLGRWPKVTEKWLHFREQNPKLLDGLLKKGYRTTLMDLAQHVGYKPSTTRFFAALRWKQGQADDGRRQVAIGAEVSAAESWEGLDEMAICQRIVREKPNFKRTIGLLPKGLGLTRAIMAAAIEAGTLSDKDIVIYTPTIEELGLLEVQDIRERWERAARNAEDMRAVNIATRVKSKVAKEVLQTAADTAVKKAVEEVSKNLRVYFIVDISASMQTAIAAAKVNLAKVVQGFPLDRVHVSIFNQVGREVPIKHASSAGVEQAFRGIVSCGGTNYGAGVAALTEHKPKGDEDSLMVFIGDEQQTGNFAEVVRRSGLNPMAFGLVRVVGTDGTTYKVVQDTASILGIPCFQIDEKTFADPYAIPRTIRALVAATPVGKPVGAMPATPRVTLVDTILKTKLLPKPLWAS